MVGAEMHGEGPHYARKEKEREAELASKFEAYGVGQEDGMKCLSIENDAQEKARAEHTRKWKEENPEHSGPNDDTVYGTCIYGPLFNDHNLQNFCHEPRAQTVPATIPEVRAHYEKYGFVSLYMGDGVASEEHWRYHLKLTKDMVANSLKKPPVINNKEPDNGRRCVKYPRWTTILKLALLMGDLICPGMRDALLQEIFILLFNLTPCSRQRLHLDDPCLRLLRQRPMNKCPDEQVSI